MMRLTEGRRAEVAKHCGLVGWLARRLARKWDMAYLADDFLDTCYIAACRAGIDYDPERGVSLQKVVVTYCRNDCRNMVLAFYAAKRGERRRLDPELADVIGWRDRDPAEGAAGREIESLVLGSLNGRARRGVVLMAGGHSVAEAARAAGVGKSQFGRYRASAGAAVLALSPLLWGIVPAPDRRLRPGAYLKTEYKGDEKC